MFKSIATYGEALSFVSRHRLWSYVLWPGLISLLLAGGVTWLAIFFAGDMAEWMTSFLPESDGIFSFLHSTLEKIASFLTVLVVLGLAVMLFKYLIMIAAAPFLGPLSEKVESIVTGKPAPVFNLKHTVTDIMRAVRLMLRNLIRELVILLLLLLLNLIPLIGSLAFTVISFLVQSYYAGFGNVDPVLERRRMKLGERVRYVRQHKWQVIGNGSVFLVFSAIPILGWFFAPALGVIAATLDASREA